jgi:hypothetical protein
VAHAQEAPTKATASEPPDQGIAVTARQRQGDVEDVPVTATLQSGQLLEQKGVGNLMDSARLRWA